MPRLPPAVRCQCLLKPLFMRALLLVCCLFVTLAGFSQSAQHVKIAGTKCSLIPPENFLPVSSIGGFQHPENGASIMVNELPAPYEEMSHAFTAEALQSKGMKLISKEVVDFNGRKATYLTVSQVASGIYYRKQILLFGDADKTVLVNGIYPEQSKTIEHAIKAALLSTVYNASQSEDPLAGVNFSVDVSGSPFKFAKYFSGTLLYTEDGKATTDKAMFIAGNSLGQAAVGDRKAFSIRRLKQLPDGAQATVQKIEPVTIDNLSGYAITAQGQNKKSGDELIYQVMLYTDEGTYFILIGLASADQEKNLTAFKNIVQTFKQK